ncbi:MAG: NYN domain-containing protein [Candidatus Promineifilaceae bacterium]|nr:NYN domain-containing protein [Candidatus Promineifilaceae bacterium]
MHYLIDGHNLIAQMQGIDLADPDDEAQLVLLLRGWVAAGKKRFVTVIFDGGLPGGLSRRLSSGGVRVRFAPSDMTADQLLISRVRQARNPSAFTLVSADREVRAAAIARKMPVLDSAAFAQQMEEERQMRQEPPPAAPEPKPLLSETEVQEWLELFGEAPPPERTVDKQPPSAAPRPRKRRPARAPEPEDPATLKRSSRRLRPDEVDEWLRLFEDTDKNET